MDSTKFEADHTRIGADIIKTGFSENFRRVYTNFFQNLSKIFFPLFSYIHYSIVIRKRILPNSGQIIPESELI